MEKNMKGRNYVIIFLKLCFISAVTLSQFFMFYQIQWQNQELFSLRALHEQINSRSRRNAESLTNASQIFSQNFTENSPFEKLVKKLFINFSKQTPIEKRCRCNLDQVYPGSVGPPGPPGPQGIQGDPGPRGEKGFGLHKPAMRSYLLNHTANVTETKIFSCTFFGNPIPEVSWIGNVKKMAIINEINNTSSVIRTSLIVNNIQWENRSELTCAANSILGHVNKTGRLTVHIAPELKIDTNVLTVNIASPALFPEYSLISNPRASITWKKGFGKLPANRSFVIDGRLRIDDVRIADEGFYVLKVANYLGEVKTVVQLQTAPLKVDIHPPSVNYINKFPFDISCLAYGRSSELSGQWKLSADTNKKIITNVSKDGVSINVTGQAFQEGTYTCEISDGKVTVQKIAQVYLNKDGGYSQWNYFPSNCTLCNNEKSLRTRQCTEPEPRGNGRPCQGPAKQEIICSDICDCSFQDIGWPVEQSWLAKGVKNEFDCVMKCHDMAKYLSEIDRVYFKSLSDGCFCATGKRDSSSRISGERVCVFLYW